MSEVTKVTGGKWVRTRKCGCGNCQSISRVCPEANSVNARWLWGSEYAGDDMPTTDSSGELIDDWD